VLNSFSEAIICIICLLTFMSSTACCFNSCAWSMLDQVDNYFEHFGGGSEYLLSMLVAVVYVSHPYRVQTVIIGSTESKQKMI
jgi:hypothetical protein